MVWSKSKMNKNLFPDLSIYLIIKLIFLTNIIQIIINGKKKLFKFQKEIMSLLFKWIKKGVN